MWRKGQSGNPTGRPKGAAGLASYIREQTNDLRELADIALKIARDNYSRDSDRLAAIQMLKDRSIGRPMTTVDLQLSGEIETKHTALLGTVDLNELSDGELAALIPVLTRMTTPKQIAAPVVDAEIVEQSGEE